MKIVEGEWDRPQTKKGKEQNVFRFNDGKKRKKYLFQGGELVVDISTFRSRLPMAKRQSVEAYADNQIIGPYFKFPRSGETRPGRILVPNPAPRK